jgi:hypothetical protein
VCVPRFIGWEETCRKVDRSSHRACRVFAQAAHNRLEIRHGIPAGQACIDIALIIWIEYQTFDQYIDVASWIQFPFAKLNRPWSFTATNATDSVSLPVKGRGTPIIVLNSSTLDSSALALETDPAAKNTLRTSIVANETR